MVLAAGGEPGAKRVSLLKSKPSAGGRGGSAEREGGQHRRSEMPPLEVAGAAWEEEKGGGAAEGVPLRQMMELVDSSEVPSVFICPISLEPMQDPVTLCTGQTYERTNILRWFATGHYICPTTMQEIWDASLTPNTTLRRLISGWYSQRFFLQRIQGEDARTRVRLLLAELPQAKGRRGRLQALAALRELAQAEESARKALAEEGGVALLSALLGPLTSHGVGAEAVGILVQLPLDSACRGALNQPAKISLMVDLLHEGVIETRVNAARLIQRVFENENQREPEFESVSSFRLLFGLLRLVKERRYPKAVAAGLSLLRIVCSCKRVRSLVVGIGAVGQIVELLPYAAAPCAETGTAVLEMLSAAPEGRKALKDCPATIPNVAGVLMGVSESCTQHALAVLLAVCSLAPEECAPVAVEAGLAAKLLLVIQSAGDPALKQRSAELLKLCSHNYTTTGFVSKCELAHTIQ